MINQLFKPMYVVCSTRKQGFHMNMVRNDKVPSPFVNFRPLIYSGQKGQRASSGWVSASYSHVLQLSDIRCCGIWQISHKCVMQKRLWLFILFYSEEQAQAFVWGVTHFSHRQFAAHKQLLTSSSGNVSIHVNLSKGEKSSVRKEKNISLQHNFCHNGAHILEWRIVQGEWLSITKWCVSLHAGFPSCEGMTSQSHIGTNIQTGDRDHPLRNYLLGCSHSRKHSHTAFRD